jgi:hypothetical protein
MVVQVGLVVTLLLIPFENLFARVSIVGRRLTDLELVALGTALAWTVLLLIERRRPAIPAMVIVAAVALVGVWVASATVAADASPSVYWFVLRSAIAASLLLVAADQVRSAHSATRLLCWLLVSMSLSAGLGIAAWLVGDASGLPGAGRLFDVGGIARTPGTFAHPNEAAVAWVATLVACLPLVVTLRSRASRFAVAAALGLLAVAIVLTVSRGGILGLAAGLSVLAVASLFLRVRAIAAIALLAGVAVLCVSFAFQLGSGLPISRLVTEGDRGLYGATYQAPGMIQASPGVELHVPVALTNTGEGTWTTGDGTGYALSYHWLDQEGREDRTRAGGSTPLTMPVSPGSDTVVDVTLTTPADTGRHRIAWDLRQGGATWFSEKSVPTVVTSIVLNPGADLAVTGTAPTYELYPEILPVPTRGELWEAAVRMVRDSPVLGIGPGQFRLWYGAFLGWPSWNGGIHANNLYLELAANTGLVGLACFLVLLALALIPQVRALVESRPVGRSALIGASLLAGMVAFLAHQVVDYFFGFTPTAVLFWVLLGAGLGVALGALELGRSRVTAARRIELDARPA